MNLIDTMIVKKMEELFQELEGVAEEIISAGQKKAKSTAIADLTTQKEMSPELSMRMGVIHIQMGLLRTMVGDGK